MNNAVFKHCEAGAKKISTIRVAIALRNGDHCLVSGSDWILNFHFLRKPEDKLFAAHTIVKPVKSNAHHPRDSHKDTTSAANTAIVTHKLSINSTAAPSLPPAQ